MKKLTTRELFDLYFQGEGASYSYARCQIDKPELYAYEQKIGKELIDMDVDDLFGLIIEYGNTRKGQEIDYLTSHSSYDQIKTYLRYFFEWYIDNIKVIKNPFNDRRMKGGAAMERLVKGREPFTWSVVENVIRRVHQDEDELNADYVELIMLLYYEGFYKAAEIVDLKEQMIDFRNHTVRLPGKTLKLSDRCFSLLQKFHETYQVPAWRGIYLLESWRGSYFKFKIRPSHVDRINDRTKSMMGDQINSVLSSVNDKYHEKINYHSLYFLGFYNFLVSKFGEEKTTGMLLSYRNSDDVAVLMGAAREYGVPVENVSHLKRYMWPYIGDSSVAEDS